MNTGQYLSQSSKILSGNGILTARLDCLILMEFVTGIDRAKLLAQQDLLLDPKLKKRLDSLVKARSEHIPIAQLTNKVEFYGRSFYVNEDVLIPRPETEKMIEFLVSICQTDDYLCPRISSRKSLIDTNLIRIVDLGTGSGALGITAKLELGNVAVDLVDIDLKALKVAQKNVDLHTIDISVLTSDLTLDLKIKYDIFLANLPYVPDEYEINKAASYEPMLAIFGGKDGLDVYRRLFQMLTNTLQLPLYILTESLPFQHRKLENIAFKSGYQKWCSDDLIQVFKRTE